MLSSWLVYCSSKCISIRYTQNIFKREIIKSISSSVSFEVALPACLVSDWHKSMSQTKILFSFEISRIFSTKMKTKNHLNFIVITKHNSLGCSKDEKTIKPSIIIIIQERKRECDDDAVEEEEKIFHTWEIMILMLVGGSNKKERDAGERGKETSKSAAKSVIYVVN